MVTTMRMVLHAGLALAAVVPAQTSEKPVRPNILFIMADDHSSTAIGCYGLRLAKLARTPHIDSIAAEGIRLENCFCTNSICAPSRAAILTGQYSHRNGVYSLHHALDPKRQNVAKLLRRAGYQTALVGKWHLKKEPSGFDYWNILPGQGLYHDPVLREKGSAKGRVHAGFSTDVITELSLAWLRRRDKSKPFCLMTHFKSCHSPWHFAKRHRKLFEGVEIPEPPSLFEDLSHRSPGSRGLGYTIETKAAQMERADWPTGQLDTSGMSPRERRRATYQKLAKDYLRCVAGIDENVGRLLAYLRKAGLLDDTLVIYTSDQGYFLGEHDYIDKRWIYEESIRMPFLARYPREIAAGTTSDALVANVDFAPTLLDYAGLDVPKSMQGRSSRSILAGLEPKDWRRSLYYHFWQQSGVPAHYGLRTKKHKLIFFHGLPLPGMIQPGKARGDVKTTPAGWELYDLAKDPQELRNVYGEPAHAALARELREELQRRKRELGDDDTAFPELAARRAGK